MRNEQAKAERSRAYSVFFSFLTSPLPRRAFVQMNFMTKKAQSSVETSKERKSWGCFNYLFTRGYLALSAYKVKRPGTHTYIHTTHTLNNLGYLPQLSSCLFNVMRPRAGGIDGMHCLQRFEGYKYKELFERVCDGSILSFEDVPFQQAKWYV
jgi:hypothetical protein